VDLGPGNFTSRRQASIPAACGNSKAGHAWLKGKKKSEDLSIPALSTGFPEIPFFLPRTFCRLIEKDSGKDARAFAKPR
jgi:hypothetical protein